SFICHFVVGSLPCTNLVSCSLDSFCAAFLGDYSRKKSAWSGILRLARRLHCASSGLSLAGLHHQHLWRFSVSHQHDRVSHLRRVTGTTDGNLCLPRARHRLWPMANFPCAILGFHRILVSALVSLALGEQSKFFCLVHSNSRPRGTLRCEFPSHVVQRDCCRQTIQNGTRFEKPVDARNGLHRMHYCLSDLWSGAARSSHGTNE